MYLEKIEIQGFKSFADRTILEFPGTIDSRHSVTIVVGPNGSGKSNISDSIKWVLGEQSMKNIRGKKSEDVIFSGSEKRSRLGYAQVSLYLNNEDKSVDIDYPQLVITRRLYRDGQSDYLINKNPVRLFDIQLLLAKAHFGQKSFSIIGQGMIDSVLLATPLERKDFFDEAVGVKEYQIKRRQSLNKLERSEENLGQAELLLKELAPQLRSLTRQVKRLEQREEVMATLREYQQEYYHRHYSEYSKTLATQKGQIAQFLLEIDALKQELNGKRTELDHMEKAESRGTVFDQLQEELRSKNDERNKLLRELTVIKGRMEVDLEKQGKLNLAWLYRQEEEITQRVQDVQKEIDQLKQEHQILQREHSNKQESVIRVKKDLEDLQKKTEQLKDELKNEATKGPLGVIGRRIKEVIISYQKFIGKLGNKESQSEEAFTALQQHAETIQVQLSELGNVIRDQIEGVSKEEEVKLSESQELWQLQQESNRLIDQQEKLIADTQKEQIALRVIEEKLRLKERDHDQLQSELKKVTTDLSNQKALEGGNTNKDQLTKQQEELQAQLNRLDAETKAINDKISVFNNEQEAKQSKIFALERAYQEKQQELNTLQQRMHTIQVEYARTETKLEDLTREIMKELGAIEPVTARPDNTETDVATYPTDHLFSQIEKFKYQLDLIGGIDPETIEEYKAVKERHDFLESQINDLREAIVKLEQVIQELDKNITTQFDKAFQVINREFERYFQILFGGGRAKLIKVMEEEKAEPQPNDAPEAAAEILDEAEETEEKTKAAKYRRSDYRGIDIYASPAGKKLSTIAMLSGGERSLTSLALIAAIISYNPSPFILMDEVDAALDEANSQRMAKVLEDLRHKTQFVIITHNRTIMSIADSIYGVTMGDDGVSKLLSVKLEEVDKHSTRL